MTNAEILVPLKIDLQISSAALDDYLEQLIETARNMISKEGIILADSVADGMIVEMYAAYLYRKRRDPAAGMPRMLRWALNNKVFGGGGSGG